MFDMKRREFITLLGGAAAAWPLAARAQQADRARRIGVLVSGVENDPEMQARLAGFRQGLERFGWSVGLNVRVDYRFAAADADRAHALGEELISLRPDVLVALATQPARALQKQTRAIPIVFSGVIDPVGAGLITSLAKPGGNLTGTLLYEESIVGKWLAMLKEISPQLARVAVMTNPKTASQTFNQAAKVFAQSLTLELVPSFVETAAEIERALEAFARVPNGGLLVLPDLTLVAHRDLVIALATRYRLPAVYQARFWVAAGGLMSYGTDRIVASRQVAYYVDRILHGEQPGDLPVQGPTRFETTLNLRSAKALNLTIPPGLLVAADEVIE
jgi:putative tryptophan/tyrosine transport system substrate-binding protein